jgi:hypothetical protein
MGRETNVDSIRDLEKQIKEGTGDVIQLKRTRNSLLNISTRVPPEILGSVFRWNDIPDGHPPHYYGMRRGSYNFLLVCHHWFEVASHTPELWSFWGNTLEQWSRRYRCSATAPLDLILHEHHMGVSGISFDGPLREALRDRAASDTIRSLHLQIEKTTLLTSILSSLTPDGEDIRRSSIEAISLQHVDVSNFFTRYRFPKLRELYLSKGTKISSWEYLGLHTTALTTLCIVIEDATPTTSQLLSILASNPRLQSLSLSKSTIPRDSGDRSTSRVPLYHLRYLSLDGNFHFAFQLLRRLDISEQMDESIRLNLSGCTVEDVSTILGPYVRDYLRRDKRSQDQLGIVVRSGGDSVSVEASTISTNNVQTWRVTFATFTVIFRENLPPPVEDKLCIDFVTCAPREHVVYFRGELSMNAVEGIAPLMPNIQELHLTDALLSDRFLQPDPDGPLANTKLLPSLRHLYLEDIDLGDDYWTPLLSYLAHQTSGGQIISLTLFGERAHICDSVMEDIEGLVEEFILDLTPDDDCPLGLCWVDEEDEELFSCFQRNR